MNREVAFLGKFFDPVLEKYLGKDIPVLEILNPVLEFLLKMETLKVGQSVRSGGAPWCLSWSFN